MNYSEAENTELQDIGGNNGNPLPESISRPPSGMTYTLGFKLGHRFM